MTDRRTQIYLTEAQHRLATKLARDRGTTLAAVVREALDRYLRATTDDDADWEGDPALDLIGCVRLGTSPADLSDEIDRTVYEEESAWSSPTARVSSPSSTPRKPTTKKPKKHGGSSRGGAGSS